MASPQKKVLVIGGTGAQGVAVVEALAFDSKYAVNVLTRNGKSSSATELSKLPGVKIIEADPYNEEVLFKEMADVDYVWANTNGFAIGQAKETYWGIRMYEIAAGSGVKHFLWAGLEYASKLGNWDIKYAAGHLDGKGRVSEYLKAQPTSPMAWSIHTSCLYMEGLHELLAPHPDPQDPETMVFYCPLGAGECPLIYLPDLGRYARWMFENPSKSNGMDLHISTENVGWEYLAKTYTEVTGKKARYQDVTLDQYFSMPIFPDPDAKVGHSVNHDDSTLQSYRQNFGRFWNLWKDNLSNHLRDYKLMDEILPDRVKSVGEWMKMVSYTGEMKSVLKDYADAAMASSKS